MKKVILLACAAMVLVLGGCASNQGYYEAVKADIQHREATQERTDMAIVGLASNGDAQAKGMAMMYFALKNAGAKAGAAIAPPVNEALQWAQVLSPLAGQAVQGLFAYKLGVVQSNNSVATEGIRYGALRDVAGAGINGAVQLGGQGISAVSNIAAANQAATTAEYEAVIAEYEAAKPAP